MIFNKRIKIQFRMIINKIPILCRLFRIIPNNKYVYYNRHFCLYLWTVYRKIDSSILC
jgi:hypothetical protein